MSRPARTGFLLAALVAAAAFPLVVTRPTWQNAAILMLMLAQLGVAWNILGGYAGQVSLGHAAFFGTGAYVSTLLSMRLGISPWIGMVAGGLTASAFSAVVGWPWPIATASTAGTGSSLLPNPYSPSIS